MKNCDYELTEQDMEKLSKPFVMSIPCPKCGFKIYQNFRTKKTLHEVPMSKTEYAAWIKFLKTEEN